LLTANLLTFIGLDSGFLLQNQAVIKILMMSYVASSSLACKMDISQQAARPEEED
jgi:hypothetical protein